MKKVNKVLYISQEIFPYLPESEIANMGRYLAQAVQDLGRETRTFMPKFGAVNERINQLHEVIRLSGMNLITVSYTHLDVYKRQALYLIITTFIFSKYQQFIT